MAAATSLNQEANFFGSIGTCAGHIAAPAWTTSDIIQRHTRDHVAAVAQIVLSHEVTTAKDRLQRPFARRLSEWLSIVVERVRNIPQAAANTKRKRIVSMDEVLANHQVASCFLAFRAEAESRTPAASSTVNIVDDFEGLGVRHRLHPLLTKATRPHGSSVLHVLGDWGRHLK